MLKSTFGGLPNGEWTRVRIVRSIFRHAGTMSIIDTTLEILKMAGTRLSLLAEGGLSVWCNSDGESKLGLDVRL